MQRTASSVLVVIVAALAVTATGNCQGAVPSAGTTLVQNVVVIDGSGAPGTPGAVRLAGDRIVAVGALEPLAGESVIDGGGRVLAPGFIDTHSHADGEITERRDALAAVGQGITTVVVGQDGGSHLPLADWFETIEQSPPAINVASYAGHNTLRDEVLGDEYRRAATAGEVEAMSSLLQAELDAGALGLSTGLEYEPGIWSEPEEVVTLAQVAAASGGRYISHVRSEDRWFWKAIDEIIGIGRTTGMPVQISHIKLAMKSSWGRAQDLIDRLEAARAEGVDITADIYPYEYWQSNMMVLIPSRDLTARGEYEFALREIAPPEGFWLTRFDPQPEYVGKKLTEIAALRGVDPVTALMQLTAESEAFETEDGSRANSMIGTSMIEADIKALLRWPHSNVCTDGSLDDMHPRGTGAFTRVLGRYVREQGLMPLEEAVHRMTGLAAAHMGFTERGLIKPGMAADLVLFDPETILDHATPIDPQAPNTGIATVWVNGVIVFNQGVVTGSYPGRVIRRDDA
jgi:N-acyl-D-amino-acid deacylase